MECKKNNFVINEVMHMKWYEIFGLVVVFAAAIILILRMLGVVK